MSKPPPTWDIRFRGSGFNRLREKKARRDGKLVYYADTRRTGSFIRGNQAVKGITRFYANRVKNELANTIPLGENSRDGHLKHQLVVRQGLGKDNRPQFYVQSTDDHPEGQGMGLIIASYQYAKRTGRDNWIEQTLKRMRKSER